MELHQLDQQIGAPGERRLLEQGLVAPMSNGATGHPDHQHLDVEPPDRGPVDRSGQSVAEALRVALDLGPLEQRQGRRVAVIERFDIDLGAAISGVDLGFANQAEAVRPEQHDVEPTVVELLDPDDVADAADLIQQAGLSSSKLSGWIIPICPAPSIASLDHLAVARLEDVQRQLRAREQDRAGQRKIGILSLRLM